MQQMKKHHLFELSIGLFVDVIVDLRDVEPKVALKRKFFSCDSKSACNLLISSQELPESHRPQCKADEEAKLSARADFLRNLKQKIYGDD